jgi:hypothetical protein
MELIAAAGLNCIVTDLKFADDLGRLNFHISPKYSLAETYSDLI